MKRTLIIGVLATLSTLSFAQDKVETSQQTKIDTISVSNKIEAMEQRLNAQQLELETLRKENNAIKSQLKQKRNAVVIGGTNKAVISRRGSKQWSMD